MILGNFVYYHFPVASAKSRLLYFFSKASIFFLFPHDLRLQNINKGIWQCLNLIIILIFDCM